MRQLLDCSFKCSRLRQIADIDREQAGPVAYRNRRKKRALHARLLRDWFKTRDTVVAHQGTGCLRRRG